MRWSLVIVLGFGMTALVQNGRADNWSTFRGPNGAGVSDDKTLPNEWSATQNVAWKTSIAGRGWSAPVVAGDKIFVTAAGTGKEPKAKTGGNIFGGGRPSGGGGGFGKSSPPTATYKFEVYCLDKATGKVLWSQTALEGRPKIATHSTNTYATETPVTDGERVYAYFGMHGVYCYDLAGKLLWKKDLGAYDAAMGWGTASSPVLHDGRLFVLVDNEQKSFLAALDAKTGEEKWRASRDEKTTYASPLIWKNKDRVELVTVAGRKARSYDPATGKVLWELTTGGGRAAATPVGDGEQLYLGTGGGKGGGGFGGGRPGGAAGGMGGGGGLFAIKAGANGDITPKKGETTSAGVAWSDAKGSTANASPLVYQGYLYILDQNGGTVTCYDVKTGKQAYKDRLRGARAFWASPWAYDGKIFCLDDGGTTHVLQAGPEFKVLGSNSIEDQFWATASLADGSLLLRGVEGVYCIKKK